jgi:hypothetical protein
VEYDKFLEIIASNSIGGMPNKDHPCARGEYWILHEQIGYYWDHPCAREILVAV